MSDKFKSVRKTKKEVSPLLSEVMGEGQKKDKGGRPVEFPDGLVKVQILVPPSLKESYKTITRKRGQNMSDPIREFMETYVEKHKDD